MAVRPIVICGEPVLHRPALPVRGGSDPLSPEELAELVTDLVDTLEASEGVGLAAPQIGVGRRVFAYACPDEECATSSEWNDDGTPPIRRGVIIDPQLETSEILRPGRDDVEGCLSFPGPYFPTPRAWWARVTGTAPDGSPVEVSGEGFFARCLQHECGHLDGRLYVDELGGRWARRARKARDAAGWGVPGHTWMPGTDPNPFA